MSNRKYGFTEQLNMSTERLQLETDAGILMRYFPCVSEVTKTDEETDKSGIDYIVKLKGGSEIGVDVKTRAKGCSKFWKNGPELALEWWSQKWPQGSGRQNKPGWTSDLNKRCQYVMFKFDEADSKKVYILPFHQLNIAFRKNALAWRDKYRYEIQAQKNADYKSSCLFIPASIVLEAVKNEFVA